MFKQYDNLMRWVTGGASFVKGYNRVLRNKGSSGVDGVKTEDLPRYLMYHWERIKVELETGSYQPQVVRGGKIPKSNGGTRQLGIPTVMDRVIQQRDKGYLPFLEHYLKVKHRKPSKSVTTKRK